MANHFSVRMVGALLSLGACTGTIGPAEPPEVASGRGTAIGGRPAGRNDHDGNPTGSGGAGTANSSVANGGPGNPAPTVLPSGAPGPTALRRLTNEEYRNTLQDLLGLGTPPTDPLLPEARSNGYDNFSGVLTVSPALATQYSELASRLAAQLDVPKLAPCPTPTADADCGTSFIKTFGKRAFRRPLTPTEVQQYRGVYDVGRMGATYADGIKLVVEAFLFAPKLLYRFEIGTPTADQRRLLTPYEIASEISYLLTSSMPDADLMAAADANTLSSPVQVEVHARRLLKSPRSRGPVRKLIIQWFGLAGIVNLNKDVTSYPGFSPTLRTAMSAETERFIDFVLWERDGTLSTLLTSPSSFVNTALAKLYGMADPKADTLVKVDLNPVQRAGILTQASVMSVHSKPTESFPIARGKFIRKLLLCQQLPPPPPGTVIVVPPPNPTLTTRERFAAHSSSPACAGCHSLIDGLGFGLENFDGVGAFRSVDNGKPVDSAGTMTGTDVDGAYTGGVELAKKLSISAITAQCAAIQAMRWTFGRMENDTDKALAQGIATQLGGGRMDMREMLVAIIKSDSFFKRTAQP